MITQDTRQGYTGPVSNLPNLRGACARFSRDGEARSYGDAHLVARWCLGLFGAEPVHCARCGVPDTCRTLHAALDWQSAPTESLCTDYRNRIYSARPDRDYMPLCGSCHARYDRSAWKRS